MAAGSGSATFGNLRASAVYTDMSPAEWLDFLEPQLDEQWKCCKPFEDYYNGQQSLQMATAKFREAFSRFFPPMANNWMKLVVDAPVSRLTVQGFRFNVKAPGTPPAQTVGGTVDPATGERVGGQTPPWELEADDDAWDIWQANNLDSISRMLHTDAVKLGVTYVLVQPPDPSALTGEFPIITPEHASQCFVYCDPQNRSNRLAGLKRWQSDVDGQLYANVYLPDAVHKFTAKPDPARSAEQSGLSLPSSAQKRIEWQPVGSVPNPMGVVPLVALENKPDLQYGGRSDLEDAIPIQDAVNKLCLDMQVSAEFHAFPQRYATGWERAVDSKGREMSGREVEVYLSQSRFVRAEGEHTRFGAFPQGNVENYLQPIEMYIDHLAAQTQTPLYYLKGKMQNMSADAMHAQDQGLVDRCQAKILSLSDGWEEVMRVAFLAKRDPKRGQARNAEVLWADVESKSLAVLVQAAMVMRSQLSVPIEMCWELLGWSPQKIRLARDLMGLPPGGAVQAAADPALGGGANQPGAPGAAEPNDPNTHPGNQPGQPQGQMAQATYSLSGTRKEVNG